MASGRVELQRKCCELEAQLAMADSRLAESRAIMEDLLLLMGSRTTCAACSGTVFWIRTRGSGVAMMFNLDGTQHWPRCAKTERPKMQIVAENI